MMPKLENSDMIAPMNLRTRCYGKYTVARNFKDGRTLLVERAQSGLFGHGTWSEDNNRIMLYPDGFFRMHIYNGFAGNRHGQEIEVTEKTYAFRGYY
jgi:hypothetical protein